MINIWGVTRNLHIPNGDIHVDEVTVTVSRDKLTDKICLEYRLPVGLPCKLLFTQEQWDRLKEI